MRLFWLIFKQSLVPFSKVVILRTYLNCDKHYVLYIKDCRKGEKPNGFNPKMIMRNCTFIEKFDFPHFPILTTNVQKLLEMVVIRANQQYIISVDNDTNIFNIIFSLSRTNLRSVHFKFNLFSCTLYYHLNLTLNRTMIFSQNLKNIDNPPQLYGLNHFKVLL